MASHDFELYEQINTLNQILEVYDVSEEIRKAIKHCLHLIKTKHYNVAVVGEFNRGKSSLINALLGGSILPTDILPTTAVINRITYGTKEAVEVFYKNGTKTNINIDEIDETVTKITKENEKKALTVNEVVIHYPAILCQNNIDLIDTPGLNEDRLMTEVTLKQLKKIDAAIMVISALSPFSDVEKNIVMNMLESNEIHNIVFVVSFIDMVNEETRPRLLATIHKRIEAIVEEIKTKHPDDTLMIEKATRILKQKKIFGVSSFLALEAYKTGNNKKLEASNYPVFRDELTKILTAGQSVNIVEKVHDVIAKAYQKIDDWYNRKKDTLSTNLKTYKKGLRALGSYTEDLRACSDRSLSDVETQFDRNRKSAGLEKELVSAAAKRLSKIKTNSEKEIRLALSDIQKQMQQTADKSVLEDYHILKELYQSCVTSIADVRGGAWLEAYVHAKNPAVTPEPFEETVLAQLNNFTFPTINVKKEDLSESGNLLHANIIRPIQSAAHTLFAQYEQSLNAYRVRCRKEIFAALRKEQDLCDDEVPSFLNTKIEEMSWDLTVLEKDHKKNGAKIEKLFDDNHKILTSVRGN